MIVTLPRGLKVDTDNIPDNLPEMVQKAFAEYTEGTAKSYSMVKCRISCVSKNL